MYTRYVTYATVLVITPPQSPNNSTNKCSCILSKIYTPGYLTVQTSSIDSPDKSLILVREKRPKGWGVQIWWLDKTESKAEKASVCHIL
jgi:hypothetical protein